MASRPFLSHTLVTTSACGQNFLTATVPIWKDLERRWALPSFPWVHWRDMMKTQPRNMDPVFCLLKKDPGFQNQVHEETSPIWAQDQWLGAEQDQLPYESTETFSGNCQEMETGLVQAFYTQTATPKLSFRAPWRVDDTVAGRLNARWTTSKSGQPCQCQNCSQGPPAEKTGRGSLRNHPSCPHDDPISQGTELQWTELQFKNYSRTPLATLP